MADARLQVEIQVGGAAIRQAATAAVTSAARQLLESYSAWLLEQDDATLAADSVDRYLNETQGGGRG